jgi:hypothetical protein
MVPSRHAGRVATGARCDGDGWIDMSSTTATPVKRQPFTGGDMVRELKAYGAHPAERRVPRGEWERVEWDRLAELATGSH